VRDDLQRIAVGDDDVGQLARFQGADFVRDSEICAGARVTARSATSFSRPKAAQAAAL